ncbi:MAG: thrombospondin type 3 repeat-containing protein [Chromatiales bacterium]|nr:thrombospondin type 3 repeat-containing protein [Chromatiales bacterium]
MKTKLTRVIAAMVATSSLLAVWGTATAAPYVLVAWHQRSTSGALSSLFFKSGVAQGCPAAAPFRQPCLNPANAWVASSGMATAISSAGLATWDWNGTTMTGTGLLWAASFISSNANGTAVISDKVTNLTITPGTTTTTASTYECVEGTFLAGVGANGCLNIELGGNGILDTSVAYNVGGSANCVNRVLNGLDPVNGDDVSTGNTRGVSNTAGGGGCDAIDGGFNQWTIVPNPRFLILANQPNIVGADGCYMFGRASQLSSSPCAADATISGASYMIFAPAVDTDSDGVVDALDNCRLLANANQADSNNDGFGNRCDGDLNNNGSTNAQDTALFRQQLGQPSVAPTYNAADINTNGSVNAQDTALFRGLLGAGPGPSGICNNTFPCPANP